MTEKLQKQLNKIEKIIDKTLLTGKSNFANCTVEELFLIKKSILLNRTAQKNKLKTINQKLGHSKYVKNNLFFYNHKVLDLLKQFE